MIYGLKSDPIVPPLDSGGQGACILNKQIKLQIASICTGIKIYQHPKLGIKMSSFQVLVKNLG